MKKSQALPALVDRSRVQQNVPFRKTLGFCPAAEWSAACLAPRSARLHAQCRASQGFLQGHSAVPGYGQQHVPLPKGGSGGSRGSWATKADLASGQPQQWSRRHFLAGGLGRRHRGQATTEVVLLFPLFMFFMFGMVKIFSLLVLVQKVEIAGFYAARRWQLESHRNAAYEAGADENLRQDIAYQAARYLGCGTSAQGFLDLVCDNQTSMLTVQRAEVWNIVTLRVQTRPWNIPLMHFAFPPFSVVKYVPNRDRPISYDLPGTI